jgi:hypothetical protein
MKLSLGFGQKTRSDQAPVMTLVNNASGTKTYALGLAWLPLVTSGGDKAAQDHARSVKADYYHYASGVMAVGKSATRVALALNTFPAALIVAKTGEQNAVYAVKLNDKAFWLAHIKNGQPKADEFITTEGELRQRLARITQEANAAVRVYSNLDWEFERTFYQAQDLTESAATDGNHRLRKVDAAGFSLGAGNAGGLIKKTAVLVGVGYLGYLGWEMYADDLKAQEQAQLNIAKAAQESPSDLWRKSLRVWEGATPAATLDGSLLADLRLTTELPVVWRGWPLVDAVCKASTAIEKDGLYKSWDCTAKYKRGEATTTYLDLRSSVPEGFALLVQPVDTATLGWKRKIKQVAANEASIPALSTHLFDTASQLQKLSSGYAQLPTMNFAPVEGFVVPKRADGSAIDRPASTPKYQSAVLTLKGSVKAIDASLKTISANWKSIKLTFNKEPDKKPDDKASELAVIDLTPKVKGGLVIEELTGVIYAK